MYATNSENGSATAATLHAGPVPCVICAGTRVVPHFRDADARAPVARSRAPYRITHSERRLVHAIVRCVDCGMVTLPQALASAAAYDEAADPYYIEQAAERIANAHRLLGLVTPAGRLLEIGCACGFLLIAARERGFAVEGIEMSSWASEYARRTYGLDVKTGCLEQMDLPGDTYDVVVMADVIEHLADPRGAIRAVRRITRPGGRLLLLTPDVGSLVARVAGHRWWGLLDDHYHYFSRQTLRRLLESEGFNVERIIALGRQFPVGHWVFKLSQYSVALHRAVARVTDALRIDRLQISINLGDQLACVAQKN